MEEAIGAQKSERTSERVGYRSGYCNRTLITRKAVTEELCGHEFSASTIGRINKTLDEELEKFAHRKLEEAYPYLILDARYEKVREDGAIRSRAVLVAIGINWEGRRSVLGVELANRESHSSWRDFLLALRERGLREVCVVSDDHAGLKKAIQEVLPEFEEQKDTKVVSSGSVKHFV